MKLRRGLEIIYILFIGLLFATGCGILHPADKTPDGYYTSHYDSCGPIALSNALDHYITTHQLPINRPSRTEISKAIQDSESILGGRACLTLLHREFADITWPYEMRRICKVYGFKAVRVKSLNDLKSGTAGVILLHKRSSIIYHWVCYPNVSDIENFYGEGTTLIVQVYSIDYINRSD